MGGGNDTHVTLLGFVAADALKAAFLKHAQQFDLHALRHVDFIEEQGTGGSLLEPAYSGLNGTSKSALFMPKQFGFE